MNRSEAEKEDVIKTVCRAFGTEQAKVCAQELAAMDGDERENCVVLCDGEAEAVLSASDFGDRIPDVVNLHRAAALSFLWEHSPVLLLGSGSFDKGDASLKDDVMPAVAFFGCDETAIEIFKALASTFAVMRSEGGKLGVGQIPVCFFVQGQEAETCRNMPYFRGVQALEKANDSRDYYEAPEAPFDVRILSVSDGEAAAALAAQATHVYAVVAHGDCARARKIAAVLGQRDVRFSVYYGAEKEETQGGATAFLTGEACVGFYMLAEKMAYTRNVLYELEADKANGTYGATLAAAKKKWKALSRQKIKRDSNLYAVIAIRQILLSLGFDCAREGEDATREFDGIYDAGNPRVRDESGVIEYDNATCGRKSLRTSLAEREHARWTAYMLACGVGPASRTEHRTEDKNALLAKGRHVNVATWEGLADFSKEEAKRKGCDEESTDVQRYDFQLADEAAVILGNNGFTIVKGRNTEI